MFKKKNITNLTLYPLGCYHLTVFKINLDKNNSQIRGFLKFPRVYISSGLCIKACLV